MGFRDFANFHGLVKVLFLSFISVWDSLFLKYLLKKFIMKKILYSLFIWTFCVSQVFAATIYIPTSTSSQYLPTVKIFAYSMGYEGAVTAEAYGSGTLINSNGIILTNNHVIEDYWDPASANDAFQICLTRSNNPEEPICNFTAALIARDADKDVAILKMDSEDVTGKEVNFDFYLPYDQGDDYEVGDGVTVIGYPDTGGRTITYTSGLISGLLTESGVTYIKTDADISFGNSGGTAVDEDGDFIGIPTYIMGSYSSEVLGYLFPISEAKAWIDTNKSGGVVRNDAADAALKDAMLANINANESGTYKNNYPPYEISLVDGWKFGNDLEGSFDGGGYGSYYGENDVIIYPIERSDVSQLYVEVSVTDYSYEVTLEDVEYFLDSYYDDYSDLSDEDLSEYEMESGYARVDFNGYDAVKDTYSSYDWWSYQDIVTVTYYIPYGDKVINVLYNYTLEDESELDEVDDILDSFSVNMDKIKLSSVTMVESDDPKIKVTNPLPGDLYLSDNTYEYDGETYFGVNFGKKRDYDFYISVYSNTYWDETYKGDFDAYKKYIMQDAEDWYDVTSAGELKMDGHKAFYYTYIYDSGYEDPLIYTYIYIDNDDESYFSIYYSDEETSYNANLGDFKTILKNIALSNEGEGQYLIPNFSGGSVVSTLSDIDNYVYEDNIKSLNRAGAFGDSAPVKFNPAGPLSRMDFVVWAVTTLSGDAASDYAEFESGYIGCADNCFEDVSNESDDAKYLAYAKGKGAVGGLGSDGKYYFAPDSQISLMAALKIIFELYDFEVWNAPDFVPWYVPYLHLGYKHYVMPYGVDNASYLLTRGEGAYIIDGVGTEAMYYSYDDDDYWY